MITLRHRLKVSTFLVLQLASDTALVERVQGMHEHQLLQLKVALLDALAGNEYTVQTGERAARDDPLRQSQATSKRSAYDAVRASQDSTLSRPETIPEEPTADMHPTQVAHLVRRDLIRLVQSNLIIAGCQMSGRKQIGQVLNKYFSGFHSSLSVEILVNALELHYEGFSQDSNAILTEGITDLIAQCGQEPLVDQLRTLL